jgi:hypothetical protein
MSFGLSGLLLTALVVILIGLLVIGIVAAVYYFIRDRER